MLFVLQFSLLPFAEVSSVVPGLTVGPLLAQLWPAAFALKQGKLFCRAHIRCPSHNQRLPLHGKVHLTGALP
jgi:hypothetical protein